MADRCFEGIVYEDIAANAMDSNGVMSEDGGKARVDLLL